MQDLLNDDSENENKETNEEQSESKDWEADEEQFEDKGEDLIQDKSKTQKTNKKITTMKSERTLFELKRRHDNNEINLTPVYQRKDIWLIPKRSKLIESILMGIPLQTFYFYEINGNDNDYLEVVDGQQRLSAFFKFLNNEFELQKLTKLTNLNGKKFNDLDVKLQRKIEDYAITIYTIKNDSDEDAKFDIFERINIGSTNLNAQEIRNCIYRGDAIEFLKKLTENEDFKVLTKKSILQKRMKDQELVLRFISFYTKSLNEYTSMTNFLNDTLENFKSFKQDDLDKIELSFTNSMRNIRKVFGDKEAFRINDNSTQINFALFDILSKSFAQLDDQQIDIYKDKLKCEMNKLKQNDYFKTLITKSNTSTRPNVIERFDIWNKVFYSILKEKG